MTTKLNLKKAIQVQVGLVKSNNELRAQLDNFNNTQFKETDNVAVKHENLKNDFTSILGNYQKQIRALFSLRKKVGAANTVNKMSERLTDEAELNNQLELYSALANNPIGTEVWDIVAQLKALKELPANQYGHAALKVVASPIHSAQEIELFKVQVVALKRKLVSLKDEILYTNIATTIDLSAEEEQVLESLGLI